MSFKKTLFFAVILAGIVAYIFKYELPREEAKKNADILFAGVEPKSIVTIRIKGQSGEFSLSNTVPAVAGLKKGAKDEQTESALAESPFAKWELGGLKGAKLEGATVGSLVTAIIGLSLDSRIPAEEQDKDLAVYGLGDPAIQLAVNVGAETRTISLGKQNEYVGKRYASISGREGIYLISGALFDAASKKPNEFRSKTPFEFTDYDLRSISLTSPTGNIKLVQGDDFNWRIVEPGQFSASSSAVGDLLRTLRTLNVLDFIDPAIDGTAPNPADYGLVTPAMKFVLEFKDAAKKPNLEFVFGSGGEAQFAGQVLGSPILYKLSDAGFKSLNKPIEVFRQKQFFTFDTEAVDSVVFEQTGGDPTGLTRSGDGWKVNQKDGDTPFVMEILQNLSKLPVIGYPRSDKDFGFTTPRLKVTVTLRAEGAPNNEKHQSLTLVVGAQLPPEESRLGDKQIVAYYAAVNDLTEAFIIDEESFTKITPRVESLIKIAPVASTSPTMVTASPTVMP